jgi:hypothetical protein
MMEMKHHHVVVVDLIQAQVKSLPTLSSSSTSTRNARGGRGRGRRGAPKRQHSPLPSVGVVNDGTDDYDDGVPLCDNCVDTVVTNPPFGTKASNAGMDVQFLKTATRLARRAVYSFHKTSTRDYLIKKIETEWKYNVKVLAKMKFDIPNMYSFHSKKSVDVEVDLIRVELPRDKEDESQSDVDEEQEYENDSDYE